MASKIRVSLIIDSESDDLLFEYLSQFPLKRRANFLRELATNDLRNRIEPWKPKTSNKTEKEIDDKDDFDDEDDKEDKDEKDDSEEDKDENEDE